MNRIGLFILSSTILLAACGEARFSPVSQSERAPTSAPVEPVATAGANSLIIYAAASLSDAFTQIGRDFEAAHPGVTVQFNFAGSQTLSTQITQGAAADVYASANHTEMDKLIAAHLVEGNGPRDFAVNKLVVILPTGNPGNVTTILDLSRPGVKLVLADAMVPAGRYAREILEKIDQAGSLGVDFSARVLANVVSNETDVKLVVTKVQLGEADAGIAYYSDAVAATDILTIEIPEEVNVIAKYLIAALVNSPNADLAAEFIEYVLSASGQAVLQQWGFTSDNP